MNSEEMNLEASEIEPLQSIEAEAQTVENEASDVGIEPSTEAEPVVTHTVDEPARPAVKLAYGVSSQAAQLSDSRAERWHQDGKALLTVEAVRDWLNRGGLVLFTPRGQQLPVPAPSLVEATLGKAAPGAAIAEMDAANTLLARLISEGAAVPLNLLGVTGAAGTDVPDFVVSAAVFSYIFTLRGNKAWKQPPVTSGPVKVSPLALATYEILSLKVTLSAYDLATQLGKEVTEAAVLRSLTELWSQLRVMPVPQLDGSATLWELTTGRFTKQIKAGANAGQPSALSALISLYLAQALSATEGEIETFLSPLASRSRVRDVIHALLSARQLETLVIDGKTLLHVTGDAPSFAAVPAESVAPRSDGAEGDSRISKFKARPGSKIGTGLRSKPAFGNKPVFGGKPGFGKPAFGADRERRPFKRDEKSGFTKPVYNKPWEEDKRSRMPASPEGQGGAAEGAFAPRTYTPRPTGDRPSFGAKPRFEGRSEGFSGGSKSAGESRPPRREFGSRPGDGPRKTFSKPGTFGRKREGFAGKPAFGPDRGESRPPGRNFEGTEGRPPRREFGSSARPAGGGFKRPGSYTPQPRGEFGAKPGFQRDRGGDEAPRKIFRKFDAPRDKKPFGAKPFTPGGDRPARTFDNPSPGGFDRPRGDRPDRPSFERGGAASDRPRGERSSSGAKSAFGGKPGGFGAKKPFSKSASFAKGGGPFAKFAEGKKPFRKPGPSKSPSGGTSSGYSPTRRKRPEGGA